MQEEYPHQSGHEKNHEYPSVDSEDRHDEFADLQEDDAEQVIVLDETSLRNEDPSDSHDEENESMGDDAMDDIEQSLDVDNGSDNADISVQSDDAAFFLKAHSSDALAVSASPADPSCIVSGGMDDVAVIWDLELRAPVATIDGAGDSVSSVAFSHDGRYVALGSENGSILIVFFENTPTPSTPLDGPGDTVNFLTWHPRGPILLAGSSDNVAYMWNAAKSKFLMAFVGHENAVTCGSFTSDGKLVITASSDSSVRVWNPSTGQTTVRIQTGVSGLRSVFHSSPILCLDVGTVNTMAESLIATGCDNGDVFISHRESGAVIAQLPNHNGGVECVKFSPPSLSHVMLVSTGSDGVVRVWDVEKSIERCKFTHGSVVAKVVWHQHKPVIASAASDGKVKLWNVLTATMIVELSGHRSFITDLCFTSDHRLLVSSSADGTVRLFDVEALIANDSSPSSNQNLIS